MARSSRLSPVMAEIALDLKRCERIGELSSIILGTFGDDEAQGKAIDEIVTLLRERIAREQNNHPDWVQCFMKQITTVESFRSRINCEGLQGV